MLTADFDRLGVVEGDRFLDLGCGFGRHAFEAVRRGAEMVALDAGIDEVTQVRAVLAAMVDAGEVPIDKVRAGGVQGDALELPFADGAFDRIVASEVLEHIPDDATAIAELARVLRPGGTMAVTVPRCGPEVVNWFLSDDYHDVPGGHIRIYRRSELLRAGRGGGAAADRRPSHPRAALALLVAALPGRPDQRHQPGRRRVPPPPGVGHREASAAHPRARAGAGPAHGQEPGPLLREAAGRRGRGGRRTAVRARQPGARGERRMTDRSVCVEIPEVAGVLSASEVLASASTIAEVQRPDGMIPWFEGGHCDPWNHVEAAMALSVCGLHARGRGRLRVAGRAPARRRQLVQLLPGRRA